MNMWKDSGLEVKEDGSMEFMYIVNDEQGKVVSCGPFPVRKLTLRDIDTIAEKCGYDFIDEWMQIGVVVDDYERIDEMNCAMLRAPDISVRMRYMVVAWKVAEGVEGWDGSVMDVEDMDMFVVDMTDVLLFA